MVKQKGPMELDLNIDNMRQLAMKDLVESMREAVKRFDDIDALERVLNAQINKPPSEIRVLADIAHQISHSKRPQQQLGHAASDAAIHDAAELQPEKPRKYKRRAAARHADRDEVRTHVLAILAKHPEGISTVRLLEMIRPQGIFDPTMSDSVARSVIIQVMKKEQKAGRVRVQQQFGKGAATLITPRVKLLAASDASPSPAAAQQAPPPVLMPYNPDTKHDSYTGQMIKLLTAALLQEPKPVSIQALVTIARANGWPERVSRDTLGNLAARALREMTKRNVTKRHGAPIGVKSGSVQYSLLRPRLEVTKDT